MKQEYLIARIAAVKRPAFLLLENVPGLLSHDQGRTFAAILAALDELGYDVAWQVLNSKDFGVPQSRKRVYLVGCLGNKCAGEILSFAEANGAAALQASDGTQGRFFIDMNAEPKLTEAARCLTTRQDAGVVKRRGEHSGVLIEESPCAVLNTATASK